MKSRALGLSLVLLAGCDAESDPFDGRQFVSESVEGFELPADQTIRMKFEDGEMQTDGGCNNTGGPYRVEDGRLKVSDLPVTQKGCYESLHEQDAWVLNLLVAQPRISVAEPRITLRAGADALVLLDRDVAEPDLPLVGTAWGLGHFVDGEVFFAAPWPVSTLTFAEDGSFAMTGGCPSVSGRYAGTAADLTLTDVEAVFDACPAEPGPGPEIAMRLFIDGAVEASIEHSSLTLTRNGTGIAFHGDR